MVGCSDSGEPESTSAIPAEIESILLTQAPGDAVEVKTLKETAKEGDEVCMHVVVGGRENPYVKGRGVITVVQSAFNNHCLSPDDGCQTPWDYCCADPDELKTNMATIRIVGADGNPIKANIGDVKALEPLSELVVKGKVGPRPNADTLVVDASGIFVRTAVNE